MAGERLSNIGGSFLGPRGPGSIGGSDDAASRAQGCGAMTTRSEKHAQKREAGFTLVELLVALSLFSLLALVLFGSLRFGLRAWELGTAHADRVEDVMFAQNLLRRLVADAYPLFAFDNPIHSRLDFDGGARS